MIMNNISPINFSGKPLSRKTIDKMNADIIRIANPPRSSAEASEIATRKIVSNPIVRAIVNIFGSKKIKPMTGATVVDINTLILPGSKKV